MKKSLITATIITASIASISLTALSVAKNAPTSNTADSIAALESTSTSLLTTTPTLNTKEESIYVITDAAGTTEKTFIGSTIYTGDNSLPLNLKISYTLDGATISASDLAGKSGHVTIKFAYTPVATYQGKFIPFLALGGTILDQSKFSNVSVTHGKLLREGDNLIAVGYAFPGLDYDLGTDFLSSEFTISADVTDFALGNTYTLVTNEPIANLDTSKLTTVDGLIGSVNDLSAGLDRIIAGTTELESGLATALAGTKSLAENAELLHQGANQLATGMASLSDGLNQFAPYATKISEGATTAASYIEPAITAMTEKRTELAATLETIPDTEEFANVRASITYSITAIDTALSHVDTVENVINTVINYADNFSAAAAGATTLAEGSTALATNLGLLASGAATLADGESQLYNGVVTLKNGLTTFKTAGINRLVDFANRDLANFTMNARNTVNAAASYRSFSGNSTESVKFIIKTASIK